MLKRLLKRSCLVETSVEGSEDKVTEGWWPSKAKEKTKPLERELSRNERKLSGLPCLATA